MKFLCDRCKTRYSIADDRVRGKILKIRCKSCANVITVREGMPSVEDDAAPAAPVGAAGPGPEGVRRPHKTPTVAPEIQAEIPLPPGPPPGSALGAAFASAMAAPPPALEQQWYVSIEGEQSGPFSLPEAQRWVAGKSPDAELHCWSEGFDDWLPVDKVSHFRGLRKKAAPPPPPGAPPALPPRAILAAAPGAGPDTLRAAALRGEVPKPMFASTMAQLERGATPSELRAPGSPGGLPGSGLPPPGMAAPGNGAAPLQARAGLSPSRLRAFDVNDDSATQLEPGLLADAADPADSATKIEPAVAGRVALRQRGDVNDDSATQLEPGLASLGTDPDATAPRMPAMSRAAAAGPVFPSAGPAFPSAGPAFPSAEPAGPMFPSGGAMFPSGGAGGDGDDLEIAEVSRVVKLTDLARDAARAAAAETAWPKPAAAPAPAAAPPALVAARAAVAARIEQLRPAEPAPGPFAGPPGEPAVLPMPELPPPPATSPRRALIALISGAVVLVGVAVAVVFFVLTGEDEGRTRLGQVEEIDTTRPDEVRANGSGDGSGATSGSSNPLGPRPVKRPGSGGTGTALPTPTAPSDLGKLEAREIEEMAGKNSSVTQRCYMRSQRGADGILIGDVKKIQVTLTINGDGQVTDAQLSDNHAQNSLGKCLITAIKSWKFRASPGGTFRFVLHFG